MKLRHNLLKKPLLFLILIAILIILVSLFFPKKSATLSSGEERLAEKIDFDKQVLVLVKKETGKELKQLNGYDLGTDEKVPVKGISFGIPQDSAIRLIYSMRTKLTPLGYSAFLTERNFGIDRQEDEIGILKTTDEYEILRVRHTNGYNYDIGPENIVAKLKEWDNRYQLEIIGADLDWFEARFSKTPDNMTSFAKEVYDFCPDVVDQGTETVEKLAEEMMREKTIYCWWD